MTARSYLKAVPGGLKYGIISVDTLDQITDLQTKVAFQEHTIETLHDALFAQQKQIQELQFQLTHIKNKLKQLPNSEMADESEETLPPHY
jgi:SlyX protein